jgi:hypothetical protein
LLWLLLRRRQRLRSLPAISVFIKRDVCFVCWWWSTSQIAPVTAPAGSSTYVSGKKKSLLYRGRVEQRTN